MRLNAQSIGLRIQQARVAKGLTQAQLAKQLGVGRKTVVRWETGKTVPKQTGIPKIATLLNRDSNWFMEGSDEVDRQTQQAEVFRAERRTLSEIRTEVKKLAQNVRSTPAVSREVSERALQDVMDNWTIARPEARLLAALLITGDWSYKLKLWNMGVSIGEEMIAAIGRN